MIGTRFILMLGVVVASLMLQFPIHAQQPCRDCPLPARCDNKDSVMTVSFRDKTSLDNCISAQRSTITLFGRPEQALVLHFLRKGICRDTTVTTEEVESFSVVGLGLNGQPCNVPVFPAREFMRLSEPPPVPNSFLEATINAEFAGTDKSSREIGVNGFYPGVEVLFAPFGKVLGDRFSLAIGGGILMERNRARIPVMGQLRISLTGNGNIEAVSGYHPNACTFIAGTTEEPYETSFTERSATTPRDSSVYYYIDRTHIEPSWRPFVFLEGGTLFNTGFDGAGAKPSLNPNDYGQFFFGAGFGMPVFGWGTVSLAYRYMRLNLRTPCPVCPPDSPESELWVVNTNEVHSILLKFGARLEW